MEFVACDYCDAPFEVEERYPVSVEDGEDGIQLYSFCDETCQENWSVERAASD